MSNRTIISRSDTPFSFVPEARVLSGSATAAARPSAQWPATLEKPNQNHHDRNDQEEVNEPAHCVRGHQAKQPENDQNDRDGFEHRIPPPPLRWDRLGNHNPQPDTAVVGCRFRSAQRAIQLTASLTVSMTFSTCCLSFPT